jgi:hypothetical protein
MHRMKNMSSMGLLWMQKWSSQICKRRVIRSNTAWPSILWDVAFSHRCSRRLCPVNWWRVTDVLVERSAFILDCWPWRQRHYSPSKCWELLAQQHSITFLQTGIYSIWDSCWLGILRSQVWDVTVCSLTDGEVWGNRIASIWVANPDTQHHTPDDCNHVIPATLPVLFNTYFIFIMIPLCLPANCNNVAWLYYTKYRDTFIITHVPLYFLHLFNPLNTELNPICHLLALLQAHSIFNISRLRVKLCFIVKCIHWQCIIYISV